MNTNVQTGTLMKKMEPHEKRASRAPASPGGVSAQSRDREAGGGLGFGARQLFEPLPDPGEGGVGGSFVVEGAEVDDLDAR